MTVDEQKQVVEFFRRTYLVGRFTRPDAHEAWEGWINESAIAGIAALIEHRSSVGTIDLQADKRRPRVDVVTGTETIKAYLIDPYHQTIGEHRIVCDRIIEALSRLIGADCLDAGRITAQGDQVWVDDTGLLSGRIDFRLQGRGHSRPLAGRAVVIGCDPWGEACDPSMSLAELQAMVTW